MKQWTVVLGVLVGLSWSARAAPAQQSVPALSAAPQASGATAMAQAAGFAIHGVIHSGSTKLPGVNVTAAHSLTGRKVITSTDIDGSFQLKLPSKGRWVLRVEFSAFAAQTAELMLTPTQPEATHDFELILLSRVPKATNAGDDADSQDDSGQQSVSRSAAVAGRGAQRLTVSGDDAALAQSAVSGEGETSSAGVSGLAASADATNQSVSVSGRMGNAQDFGLQNMDDLRDRMDDLRARGQLGAGRNGGGDGGGGGFGMGGPPGGAGGGGGGRMRMGSMTKPHGQIYYNASNGALDASPYAVSGQQSQKPGYGSNHFGGTLGGVMKIPHLYDDGGKTFVFLNYSGTRSATPYDMFSHVPTLAERGGDFSGVNVNGSPVQLFDPANPVPGTLLGANGMSVPAERISPQATALLKYIPLPNVTNGSLQNYRFTSAADADLDLISIRLTHNFGAPTGQRGGPGGGGAGGRRSRNNLSFGLNYQRNESDILEPFSTVGGNTHTNGFNANTGWALSKGKLSNQLRFTWNRSRAHTSNYYAGTNDVASQAGISGVSYDPLNWGVPGLAFSDFTSLSDVSPLQRDSQTFSLSESFGWVRGKHHLHFGTDYRWIDNKAYSSSNPRGGFTFTGSSTAKYVNGTSVAGTGYDFADFLLGYAQQTTLAYSQVHDQYLAQSYDFFAQDDWRVTGNLTLNYGLRYEFISPFREAHDRLTNLLAQFDAECSFQGVTTASPNGRYGSGLVNPDRNNFAPRLGIAWKPFGLKTVVRAGYSVNYNLGEYASIVQNLAAQPPFAVTQTNAAPANAPSALTLAAGFPTSNSTAITNNYGIDPNYRVAYVQMWNLNVQQELTPTLLLNVGYTGSKGTALDMLRAPNRGPDGLKIPDVESFNWETSQGASILHAGSVRLRKRMTNGVAVGGTYTYSKSIDNASSIGGGAQVVAQDDTNLRAERGLSIFDQRHKLSGDWTLELPWGEGRKWLTKPTIAQKVLGSWLLQSTFTVASGTPFTARVLGDAFNVAGGVNGTLRADYNGEPIQTSDRSIRHWFNTSAFSVPASGTYGNSGRNTIIGPGSWLMSLVLSKNIPLKDSTALEMRAEADNVLNHPNYSGLDTTVNSPTFGEVTSVASMRKMTLSMHYRF
jgi:outer membrane receptor protein involved in Fe transport